MKTVAELEKEVARLEGLVSHWRARYTRLEIRSEELQSGLREDMKPVDVAEVRRQAFEEASAAGMETVMKFRRKVGGKYYAGYHEDMRDAVYTAIRALSAAPATEVGR